MTARLPVVGSTAATTAFCSERIEGPQGTALYVDGNGKITARCGTLKEPKPNAFSLPAAAVSGMEHCPQSTETCRKACLASSHKVLTADLRYVPLSSVQVGDKLTSFDEEALPGDRRVRYRTGTVQAIEQRWEDTYTVTLASGKRFIATKDHKWRSGYLYGGNYEWRYTDQLRPGVHSLPRMLEEWEPATSFEAGWLSGMFDGEGCLYVSTKTGDRAGRGRWALTLSQKAGPVLERVRQAIKDILGEDSRSDCAQDRDVWQTRIKGGRKRVAKVLGMLRPTRLLAKFTPDLLGEVWTCEHDEIVSVEPSQRTQITSIAIDTGTMIVEGYGHHNCYVGPLEKAQRATYDLYEHNATEIRRILADGELANEWVMIMAAWISEHCPDFRWHVSGDVFSFEYAQWIADVCRESPKVRHWIYTRSFESLEPLAEVSTLLGGNLSLNLSCDADNYAEACEAAFAHGKHDLDNAWHEITRHRLAYLTVDGSLPDDLDPEDVVFPDYQLRPRQYATLAESPWWQQITPEQRGMVCPVDGMGKAENRRCGPCARCMV